MESTSKRYLWSRCDYIKEYYALRDYVNFNIGETVPVIASLGAVIVFLSLVVGTLSALLVITHKHYKIGIVVIINFIFIMIILLITCVGRGNRMNHR